MDIKTLHEKVVSAGKYTPLSQPAIQTKSKPSAAKDLQNKTQPGFESWEVEKKYKTKL